MAFIILFILLFAFSTFVDFQVGTSLGERAQTTADYWKMNAGAIVAAVLLTLVCSSMPLLWAAIIGMLAGAIAGMKMSFGESVGPWKAHDEFFNVNKEHRRAAEEGTGERRRAAKRAGKDAPELISTVGDANDADENVR